MPNVSKFMVKLFADDTLLAMSGKDLRSLEKNVNTVVSGISDIARDRKNRVGYAEYRICRILMNCRDMRFFRRYL